MRIIGYRGFEWMKSGLLLAALGMSLQACTTTSNTPAGQKGASPEAFNHAMAEGNAAVQASDLVKAHAAFDQAAKADPASKQPWLRKAQIALDASDFGLAIQASQEVTQRDGADVTAKSIVAVAGLRAASQALRSLRQNNAVNGSTRGEAETLARTIREALGEETLVPVAPARPPRPVVRAAPPHSPASPSGGAATGRPAPGPGAASGSASDPFSNLPK